MHLQSLEDQHIARQERRDEKESKEAASSGSEAEFGSDSSEAELDGQVCTQKLVSNPLAARTTIQV